MRTTRAKLGFGLLAFGVVAALSLTPLFGNGWLLLTGNGFEIPDESSVFSFRVKELNPGSGDWWLRAEDGRYVYHYSDTAGVRYHAFPKAKIPDCPGFRPDDLATWCREYVRSPQRPTEA